MADWYDSAYDQMIQDAAKATRVAQEDVLALYSYLSGIGLIDYDIEKEIFHERYGEDDG